MYNSQLDTFIEVVQQGSFSRAAGRLFITPTAVLRQMNSLERNLGVTLFLRSHHGLTLTPAGEEVYRAARRIVALSRETIERARAIERDEQATVRIGVSLMTPNSTVADLLPAVGALQPKIAVRLVSFENNPANTSDILANLETGSIDVVAGIFDDAYLNDHRCAALEIARVPLRIAVPSTSGLAERSRLAKDDLAGRTILLIQRGWNGEMDRLRDELAARGDVAIEDFAYYSVDVYNHCAQEDALLVTIDSWRNVHPLLTTMPVDWDYTVRFGLFHAPEPSARIRTFLEAVKRAIPEHGALPRV